MGGSYPTGTPDGVKVVLPRAPLLRSATAPAAAPPAATLAEVPWVVLQLQSLDENDPPWSGVLQALQRDIDARAQEEAGRCTDRLTFL